MSNSIILLIPYVSLIGVLIGNAIESTHNRKNIYFFISILVICWLISWTTVGGPDYMPYYSHYQNIGYPSKAYFKQMDVGYNVLVYLFKTKLHMSFNGFRAVVYGIGFSLIGRAIWKCSNHPNFIILIYSLTLLAVDTVQIRNFIASSLLFYALYQVLSKKYLRTALLIFIASLFHKTFLLYLIIPVLVAFRKDVHQKDIVIFAVSIYLIAIFLQIAKPFIHETVARLLDVNTKLNQISYLKSESRYGHWLQWGCHLLTVFLFFLFLPADNTISENYQISVFSAVLKINIALIVLFPLFLFDNNYMRFYRNLYIFNLIWIYEGYMASTKKNVYRTALFCLYLLVAIYCYSAANDCVPPIFLESLLFRIRF